MHQILNNHLNPASLLFKLFEYCKYVIFYTFTSNGKYFGLGNNLQIDPGTQTAFKYGSSILILFYSLKAASKLQ